MGKRGPAPSLTLVGDCSTLPIGEAVKAARGRPGAPLAVGSGWKLVGVAVHLDAPGGPVVALAWRGPDGAAADQAIALAALAGIQGTRWMAVCPGCRRRVTALYRPQAAARYECRTCHRLAYASQRNRRPRSPFAALARRYPEAFR